jgi:hypothetical protein
VTVQIPRELALEYLPAYRTVGEKGYSERFDVFIQNHTSDTVQVDGQPIQEFLAERGINVRPSTTDEPVNR